MQNARAQADRLPSAALVVSLQRCQTTLPHQVTPCSA